MEDDITLQQSVEYVDAICLDKGIILPDGCTTATLTTVDGESLPVTLIVSQPMIESGNCNGLVEESIAHDGCEVIPEENGELNLERKDDPPTVYTVHFPSDSNSKEDDSSYLGSQECDILDEDKSGAINEDLLEQELLETQPDIESLSSLTRLEDFMDVVTTYKCKFCRFSCPWKSGLMSHLRCCHISEKNCLVTKAEKDKSGNSVNVKIEEDIPEPTKDTDDDAPSENVSNLEEHALSSDLPEEIENKDSDPASKSPRPETDTDQFSSPESPTERHIFLCGQCSDGFASLEECKQHMVDDHNLKLDQDSMKLDADETKVVRKRGRPRTRPRKEKTKPPRKRTKKETLHKEPKQRNRVFKNLVDEFDCCIKRKLRTGFVNDRAFRCTRPGCGHRFTSESNLHYHYTSHSSLFGKPFMCPECREEFKFWRQVATHLWREHTIDIDLHACPECDYKSFSFFKLDNHRKIHSDERAYVCETCGKGFKQISQLRNHVVIHMDRKNLPEKRWYSEQECETCGRKFSDTKCLRKHQQEVHNKSKPYICSFCGHLSARKAMLELHMRQHTGEKPFLCEHCEYRTGDHNSLRRHRMRHTGDKPYKCPHCPYACIQAISYKTHLRNKHPGMEGLFSCTLCTFKSVSRENYLNHMSDHKRHNDNLTEATATLIAAESDMQLDQVSNTDSVQMQLSDNALQQLEGFLPGNMTAAQLIYSCLSAMSQDGGAVNLPSGVTVNIPSPSTTASTDGTQTITIQLPSSQEAENEPYYFTIQQQDGTTALVLPNTDDNAQVDDNGQESSDMEGVQLTEHDISNAAASLDCNVLPEGSGQLRPENSDLVIAQIESLTDPGNFNEMMANSEIPMQSS